MSETKCTCPAMGLTDPFCPTHQKFRMTNFPEPPKCICTDPNLAEPDCPVHGYVVTSAKLRPVLEKMERDDASLRVRYAKLYAAASLLYHTACWHTSCIPADQAAELWESLRDALGIEAGTATELGVAPKERPAYLDATYET